MKNQPYVKQFENGVLKNPINAIYTSPFKNRRQRRMSDGRPFNNKKGIQLVVTQIGKIAFMKHVKVTQEIEANFLKGKKARRVYHSIPVK